MSTSSSSSPFGELYSAYAAGCLDPGFALLVETQAALRPDIAKAVRCGEIIAAASLEREPPAAMSADACLRTLAAIDAMEEADDTAVADGDISTIGLGDIHDLPMPLQHVVMRSMEAGTWQFALPGVRRLALETRGQAETELYRLDPGAAIPRHSHEGNEFTLVVTGSFADETGTYRPGEIAVKGADQVHRPAASLEGTCYALAVRDGGLRFTGLMGAVQRILGQ